MGVNGCAVVSNASSLAATFSQLVPCPLHFRKRHKSGHSKSEAMDQSRKSECGAQLSARDSAKREHDQKYATQRKSEQSGRRPVVHNPVVHRQAPCKQPARAAERLLSSARPGGLLEACVPFAILRPRPPHVVPLGPIGDAHWHQHHKEPTPQGGAEERWLSGQEHHGEFPAPGALKNRETRV